MQDNFSFENLFICEMANNHQGDLSHALKIVEETSKVTTEKKIHAGIKVQFRKLESFIHPDFRKREDIPHIKRFKDTKLSIEDFSKIIKSIQQKKLLSIATPFDEASVELFSTLGIEVLKIASCSSNDWPLLEEASKTHVPIIVSTGGLRLEEIDELVNFLTGKRKKFALLHCVAIYPNPKERLRLRQIELMSKRYPEIPIGFSSHEEPNYTSGIKMAYAYGARLFERHVGVPTDSIKLNAYSVNPEQLSNWIEAFKEAKLCAGSYNRSPAPIEEAKSLRSLKRGVYAKTEIAEGQVLERKSVFFAMPLQDGQMTSGEWSTNLKTLKAYKKNEPIAERTAAAKSSEDVLQHIVEQLKGMLNEARISIGKDFKVDLSHHYGIERFREFGAVLIECISRVYAKKLVIQLPRQKHPYHYHQDKEETFLVLYGDLQVEVDGHTYNLNPGDTLTILPRQWHKFQSSNGVIFEEISTAITKNGSVYDDPSIQKTASEERKTDITKKLQSKPTTKLKAA